MNPWTHEPYQAKGVHLQLTQLKARLQHIEDLSVLHHLLMDAVKVESVEAFVRRLDELRV